MLIIDADVEKHFCLVGFVCSPLENANMQYVVLHATKAVKALQEETSEDFSSADEWQTAKAKLRR